jgi:hypothetical protein
MPMQDRNFMKHRTIKRLLYTIAATMLVFIVDRYLFMENRIIENNWSFERGNYIQDPIHFGQHCELRGDKVFFYKTNEELKILGCYFGQLFLYDEKRDDWTRYSQL